MSNLQDLIRGGREGGRRIQAPSLPILIRNDVTGRYYDGGYTDESRVGLLIGRAIDSTNRRLLGMRNGSKI